MNWVLYIQRRISLHSSIDADVYLWPKTLLFIKCSIMCKNMGKKSSADALPVLYFGKGLVTS